MGQVDLPPDWTRNFSGIMQVPMNRTEKGMGRMSFCDLTRAQGNPWFLSLLDPEETGGPVREKQSLTPLHLGIGIQHWPACSIQLTQRNTAHRDFRSIQLLTEKTFGRPNSQGLRIRFKNSCALPSFFTFLPYLNQLGFIRYPAPAFLISFSP